MQLIAAKKTFASALSLVERIIPSRNSNPGLTLMRLQTRNNKLVLSGTNIDIDLEATLDTDVQGEGDIALPAVVLAQVVRSLPGDTVQLEATPEDLRVTSGTFDTKLQLAQLGEAPTLNFPDAYEGTIDGQAFARALSHVRYAAAVAEYQAVFRGVKLELVDTYLRAVATDGFRLAYYHLDTPMGISGEIIIPARAVDELLRVLDNGVVRLALSHGQLSLASGSFRANIKLMEGSFPDYGRVIPSQFPLSVTTNADIFRAVVDRVSVMAEKTSNNRIDLHVRNGVMHVTAESTFGRSEETLEVTQAGTDHEMMLSYNAKYLEDALSPLHGEVVLQFSGPVTPTVLNAKEGKDYKAMVVPLRT